MVFTCHSVVRFGGATAGWAVVGQGRLFTAPLLSTAMELARKAFPEGSTTYREGSPVAQGEEHTLLPKEPLAQRSPL